MNKLLILCLILISVISCNSKKDNNQIQTNGSNEKNQELNQLEKNRHKYKTVSTDGESGILCASNFNDEFSCWADKNLTIWDSQNNNYFDLLEVPANLGNVKKNYLTKYSNCTLSDKNILNCWGWKNRYVPTTSENIKDFFVSNHFFCSLDVNDLMACWTKEHQKIEDPYLYQDMKTASIDGKWNCYLNNNNDFRCSYYQDYEVEAPKDLGVITKIFSNQRAICVLNDRKEATCWYVNLQNLKYYSQVKRYKDVVGVGFADLDSPYFNMIANQYCILHGSGDVECDYDIKNEVMGKTFLVSPPKNLPKLKYLTGRAQINCGIDEQDQIICWNSKGNISIKN